MKYLTIVTFLLIIHVSAAIVNSAEYTAGYKFQPDEEAFKEIEQDVIKEQSYLQNVAIEDTSVSFGFGDFFRGIWIFVKTVWLVIIKLLLIIKYLKITCGELSLEIGVYYEND